MNTNRAILIHHLPVWGLDVPNEVRIQPVIATHYSYFGITRFCTSE